MKATQLLTTKYNALDKFKQRLLSSDVRDQVARMVLFGSVARGDALRDSDVDVLIFGFGDLRKISKACAEVALDIGIESGEYIQSLVYSIDESSTPRSYFLYMAERDGKEIYSMDKDDLRDREVKDYLVLAQEYFEVAESSFASSKYRTAVDLAYNAAESCARGLLLQKLPELPRSHGGLIAKFGELYMKDGPLPRRVGSDLNLMLELRSRARYDAHVLIDKRDAQDAIELAETLMRALREQM
jgi:uncharacterized protein (UPF0332 family)/predicted nucleotidyltransferase